MKYLVVLSMILNSYALQIHSYAFVCNGVLADGTMRHDSCGVCNEHTAARWPNPNVPVIVDYETVPKGLKKSEWRDVIKMSFAAWNQISGSNFRFIPLEAPSRREFGASEAFHEIYWITDVHEWRRVVGTGEMGTYGATVPKYTCGQGEDNKRVIVDSDMVLNGLKHINWQMNCNKEDCISPQTTVVHELGHFLGLDHPCLSCSTSVMSARASFDLKYPMLDDMQGLRVLYPGDQEKGFGSLCTKDEDCLGSQFCLKDKNINYCTNTCTNDQDCEQGALCQEKQGTSFCAFINAGSKVEGENCTRVPCVDPLVCAGPSFENSFCFAPCTNGQACAWGQECIVLKDDNVSICVTIKQKGELCFDSQLCDRHLYCVSDSENAGVCREQCGTVNALTTGCPSGETCEIIEGRYEICMPSGELSLTDNSDAFGPDRVFLGRENMHTPRKSGCQSFSSNNLSLVLITMLFILRRSCFMKLKYKQR